METKKCSTCKQVLPVSDFYPHKRMKSGLQSNCRYCAKKWRDSHPKYIYKKRKQWISDNPNYSRDWQRRSKGITEEMVTLARQTRDNRCAGCLRVFDGTFKECADHCHSTNVFRGLLCDNCNRTLGAVKDSPEILQRLINYLASNCKLPLQPAL